MGIYKNYIVKNAHIFDGEKYLCGDIEVVGDKIVSIGTKVENGSAEIIDVCGRLLTPGLVDIHTHLKNVSCDMYGTDISLCTIPFGVTSAVDGGASKGDKAYLDTLSINTAVFVEVKVKDNAPCLENVEAMREKYGGYFAGIKLYLDTSNKNVKDIGSLKKACEYAEKHGYKVMVHTTGTPAPMTEIVEVLKHGDILTHAYHGGDNTSEVDNFKAIFAAKEKGVVIDAGMACHVHTDFNVFGNAIKAGALPDTISTDITKLSAYTRGGRYGLTMCMGICKHLGMREEDILKCVTTNAAKAVDRHEWGTLKAGENATFAVFDTDCMDTFSVTDKAGNHIEGEVGYKCVFSVRNGEILYRI
ncbi:MAG: amidohydrolase family protein [Clostridia bacterium]|nr:amidohydrolase family protein [Clostridia bacterium]